jgi:hypothetical protein
VHDRDRGRGGAPVRRASRVHDAAPSLSFEDTATEPRECRRGLAVWRCSLGFFVGARHRVLARNRTDAPAVRRRASLRSLTSSNVVHEHVEMLRRRVGQTPVRG